MFDDLIEQRPSTHSIQPFGISPGPELIRVMRDVNSDFAQANLADCFEYIRGGKGLNLPSHWKTILPSFLPKRANPWEECSK